MKMEIIVKIRIDLRVKINLLYLHIQFVIYSFFFYGIKYSSSYCCRN